MPYTLTAIQDQAFQDVIDMYAPVANTTGTKRDQGDTYAVAYSGVRCHIQPSSEILSNTDIGRSNKDIVLTTDILRMHMDQQCETTWFVRLKTPGHPEYNSWFSILGDHTVHSTFALEQKRYIAKSNDPRQTPEAGD